MVGMTDPHVGLLSLQKFFAIGAIDYGPGNIDPNLFVHIDFPNGETDGPRLTYFIVEDGIVAASAVASHVEPVNGLPCLAIGYAVAESFRNRGMAKRLVAAAIEEMKYGFGRTNLKTFFVEAIVGIDNIASQHVATTTISDTPSAVTDAHSGLPAFQYLRRIDIFLRSGD